MTLLLYYFNPLLYYKMTKTWNKFKKPKRMFFCFTEWKYAACLLSQHRQLTNGRNVCGTIFWKGAIHKALTLK